MMMRYLIGGLLLLAGVLFYLVQSEYGRAQPDGAPAAAQVAPRPATKHARASRPIRTVERPARVTLEAKPQPREGEPTWRFEQRVTTTRDLVKWMDESGLDDSQREALMVAIYDATSRYVLAAESLGVMKGEERLTEMMAARVDLDATIRGMVTYDQYVELMKVASPSSLIAAEVADPAEARAMFQEMYGTPR